LSGVPRFDVVGVGANSIDFVCHLPAYPEPSGPRSKLPIARYERSPGGQTATVASACASLGLRASYIGTISGDENGALIRKALGRHGVDCSAAIARGGQSAFAVILLADSADAGGERIVLWKRPAEMTLSAKDLPGNVAAQARVVHVDDVDMDAAIGAARAGVAAGIPVTSDIEAVKPGTVDLVGAVTIPIFAEHVPGALTGEPDLERALRQIRTRHPGLLCVTLGAQGAALLDGDRFIRQPACRVDAIDTTGAGDIFRAGFIYALLRGDRSDDILRFACAAAAVSCTREGAINSVPTLEEATALMEQTRRGRG
jgi:sulfofructose kinase